MAKLLDFSLSLMYNYLALCLVFGGNLIIPKSKRQLNTFFGKKLPLF